MDVTKFNSALAVELFPSSPSIPWPGLELFLKLSETMPAQETGEGEKFTVRIGDIPPIIGCLPGSPWKKRHVGTGYCWEADLPGAVPSFWLSALSSSGKNAWDIGLLLMLNQTEAEMGGQPWGVLSPHKAKTLLFVTSLSCHSQLPSPLWDVYCVHWNWQTGQQGLWAGCLYRAGSMCHSPQGCCVLPQKCKKWIKKIARKRPVTQLGLHCLSKAQYYLTERNCNQCTSMRQLSKWEFS